MYRQEKVQGIGIEKMLRERKEIKKEGKICAGRGFTIYEGVQASLMTSVRVYGKGPEWLRRICASLKAHEDAHYVESIRGERLFFLGRSEGLKVLWRYGEEDNLLGGHDMVWKFLRRPKLLPPKKNQISICQRTKREAGVVPNPLTSRLKLLKRLRLGPCYPTNPHSVISGTASLCLLSGGIQN